MKNLIKLSCLGLVVLGVLHTPILVAEDLEALAECESCHTEQANEFQMSVHYINRSGVQAGCNKCHAGQKHKDGANTTKITDKPRIEMAKSEWMRLKTNESKECKTCHSPMAMDLAKQEPRSVESHEESFDEGDTSCINCHQGISHYLPDGWEKHKSK